MGGKVRLRCKGKTLLGVEFSLKEKVMGEDADYLLKSFLLYPKHFILSNYREIETCNLFVMNFKKSSHIVVQLFGFVRADQF